MNEKDFQNTYKIHFSCIYNGETLSICTYNTNNAIFLLRIKGDKYQLVEEENIESCIKKIFHVEYFNNFEKRIDYKISGVTRYKLLFLVILKMKDILLEVANTQNQQNLIAVVKKFNKLKIVLKGYSDSMQYFCSKFLINIPANWLTSSISSLDTAILHELLHCAGDDNTNGLLNTSFSKYYNNKKNTILLYDMLNEAITQYLALTIYEKNQSSPYYDDICLYDINVIAIESLLKLMDRKKVVDYYVSGNLEGFIDYFAQEFHINNKLEISKFFEQMNNTLVFNQSNLNYIKNKNAISHCNNELFKTVFNFLINKYIVEDKDLNQLKFEDILSSKRKISQIPEYKDLLQNNELRNYFESAKFCLKYLKNCTQINQKINHDEFINLYSNMVFYSSMFLPLPNDKKYEKMQNYEVLSNLLKNNLTDYAQFSFIYDHYKNLINTTILNPKNNYLPKNKAKRNKILEKLIYSNSKTNRNILDAISDEILLELSNNNQDIFDVLLNEKFTYVLSNIDKFPTKYLSNEKVIECFFKNLSTNKQDSNQNFDLILNLYLKLDKDFRQTKKITNLFLNNSKRFFVTDIKKYRDLENVLESDKKGCLDTSDCSIKLD